MKRKKYFLRMFALLALMLPWTLQAQNAKVSEYDYAVGTATYSSIAGTSGATAWTAADQAAGYVDVTMPFAMYFGETQIATGSTLRVYPDGAAEFTSLSGSMIAPLYNSSGYTTTASSIYTKSSATVLTVEWRKVVSGSNMYSFQLKLYPGGDIEFCYGPMTLNSSISVLVGMMSSDADIFRVGGANESSEWNDITRYTSGSYTRTLSATYAPAYNVATNQGVVYTFTQPACVKPNTLTSTSIEGGANLAWDSRSSSFQIKYSTDPDFNPATEGTQVTSTTTTKTLTGLTNFTTYYWYVRAVCSGTPSAWSERGSFLTGTVVNMGQMASLTTCNAMIVDNGGMGDYEINSADTLVINPATTGKRIRLTGTYNTEDNYDGFYVYDGDIADNVLLGNYTGTGSVDIAGDAGALTIVFYSDNSVVGEGFVLTAACENIPTCPNPAAPSVTAEGVVTWTASGNATSYDILWGATGFNPASAGTAVNGITGLTTTLTGLSSTTTYDVYLRAHCSATNEVSAWVGPATFTTPCLGSCTHVFAMEDSYGDGWENHTLDLYVNGEFQQSITLSSGYSGSETVYLCPGTSFYYVWHWNGGSQYGENSFTITNHDNEIVVSMTESDLTDGMIVYSGTSCFTPTCPAPNAPTADAEANVSWTASNNATSYDLLWGLTGFDPATAGTLVANLSGTSYTLTGWESNSVLDVYVRAHCSATNEVSDWSNVTTFVTACAPLSLPYSEDFSSYTSLPTYPYYGPVTIPTCWSFISNGTNTEATSGSSSYYGSVASSSSTSSYASMEAYNNYFAIPSYGPSSTYASARGSEKIAVLPNFTQPISSLSIYFDYKMSSTSYGTLQLGYYSNGAFTALTNVASVSATTHYEQIMGSLDGINAAPAGARIALRWFQSSGSSAYWVGIDNVEVEVTPTCFKPTWNTASITVGAGTATLAWTGNSNYKYEVMVGPRGFDPNTDGRSTIVTTNTVTLDYLYLITEYDAYVRGICADGDTSAWSNVYEFKSGCPNGGDITVGDVNSATTSTYLPEYHFYNYSYSEQIFTPAELGGAGSYSSISFFLTQGKAGLTRNVDIYLKETTKTSFESTTDWSMATGAQLVYSGSYSPAEAGWMTIDFNQGANFNYSGENNLLLIFYDKTGSYVGSPYATYKTSSSGTNTSMYKYQDATGIDPMNMTIAATSRLAVHNVIKLGAPCDTGSCNAPQTVVALSETEYAATLTFTDVNGASNPSYGIVWGPQGFDPATSGTTVSPITTNSYTISGLSMLTSYDVYVYAICGSENGRMVRYTFTTPFIPNCKVPILTEAGFGASNVNYTTATVSWRQPGDTPLYWVVRYAETGETFTEVQVNTNSINLTGLTSNATHEIQVKAVCATSPLDESPWSDVYYFTTPACVAPVNVTASDITNSTVQISWIDNASTSSWTLVYGPQGFDPDLAGTTVATTTPTIELTGLDAYAYYDVYVKSNCTSTVESLWSDVCTFRTACPDGGEIEVLGTTATTNYTLPMNTYYGYSYTQQIITAEEMGGAANINSIAFSYAYTSPNTNETNVDIFIGATSKSSFSSNTDFEDPASLQLVYSGPLVCTEGWNEFTFTTPFAYDGSSNVIVALHEKNSSYSGSAYKFNLMSTPSTMALSYYSDSYVPDPTSSSTLSAFSGTKSTYSYRSLMKFVLPCNVDVTCFAPASASADVNTNNTVVVQWAPRTDLRPVVNNYELKYGLEGFNPETSGTLVSDLNNVNTYTITADLAYDQDYDLYVRTVCGNGDYSNWTKTSFHTYPSCWAPTDLTVLSTTQTSATLTWTETTPNPADRWEVVAGLPGFDPDRATAVETTNRESFEMTGLRHSTKYEFYVRAKCSATDHSPWSLAAVGTTQCDVMTYEDMPLVENFDGVTGTTSSTVASHVLPNCWNYLNGGTTYPGYPIAYNGVSYSHSGNNHMRFYESTAAGYSTQYAILPQFASNFEMDSLIVSFYARESSTTTTYVGTIEVGVMTDPSDGETFEVVGTALPTTTSYEYFEVDFSEYTGSGRYVALRAPKPTTGYNVVYLDDLTVRLREKVNMLSDNGETMNICSEFVLADTTNGGQYHGNVNATYVIHPATAGQVVHLTGSYDLEYGYDFLKLYRGGVAAANLIATYTGAGEIDYMTGSNLWADSGYVTLVFTTDADNAMNYDGFKLLASCECPMMPADPIVETEEANGTFTWRNGLTYTNVVSANRGDYGNITHRDADADLLEDVTYIYKNVAGCDSIEYNLNLTLHPTYEFTYTAEICDRDNIEFYGQTFDATGTYSVTLTTGTLADSVGILNLQRNPAPTASIYYNGREVMTIENFCDNADLTLLARSNMTGVTFTWDDESTAEQRVVNPHESDTYTVIATEPNHGCTSLPASLTVTTTPVPALTISGTDVICYGQSTTLTVADANNTNATYRWSNGASGASITVNPTETTTYTVTATSTLNTSACAATAEYTVTVNPLPVVTATASASMICRDSLITLTATEVEGYSYEWNTGATTAIATTPATATSLYTVTVTDQNGCVNEFNTADVTVYPSYEVNSEMSVCYLNNPYTWEGMTLTADGNYDQMLQTRTPGRPMQCDSLVHLTFTFQQMGVENTSIERCFGTTYTFEGITREATVDTNLSYIDNSGECPVQYNLAVTVNPLKATVIEQVACDNYTWTLSNESYSVSGDYPVTLQTTKGCDSVVTLHLTVNYKNTGDTTVTACDSYEWWVNGATFTENTETAIYTFVGGNEFGCDSTVTLHLTVNYHSDYVDNHCVYNALSYTWVDGQTYSLNVTEADNITFVTDQNDYHCDNVAHLTLTIDAVADTLNWTNIEVCDEYVLEHVIMPDEDACTLTETTQYLRETGDYQFRTRNAALGHDQWTRIHLTVNPSSYHTTVATGCLPYTWIIEDQNGDPFEVMTITATMVDGAPVYNRSVDLAEAGYVSSSCASIEVLRLTPLYPSVETTYETICQTSYWEAPNGYQYNGADLQIGENDPITWRNTNVNDDGCPLTENVVLTVNPVYNVVVNNVQVCESQFENGEYTMLDINTPEAGTMLSALLTIPGDLDGSPYSDVYTAEWTTAEGCTSTLTVNYTVTPTLRDTLAPVTACESYTWDVNGQTYRESGEYTEIVYDNIGCTIFKTLPLTILMPMEEDDVHTVCNTFEYDGVTYRESMTFDEVIPGGATNGCDLIVHHIYNVIENTLIEQYVTTNEPYTWRNGVEYTADVLESDNVFYGEDVTVPGAEDCQIVYRLHLTVVDGITLCVGELPYTTNYNDFIIPADAQTGVYTDLDANGSGYIIAYTINDNTTATVTETACDSYTWTSGNGQTYTESGQYFWETTNAAGCVHTVTLDLTVGMSSTATVTETACDSYTWTSGNGQTYTESGSYVWNTTNADNCPMAVTLNLTINSNAGVEVSKTACDTYTWAITERGNGQTYTESGIYSYEYQDANGCTGDSTLNLTINTSYNTTDDILVNDAAEYLYNGVLYTAPFDDTFVAHFTAANGCDSTVTVHLVIPDVSNAITELDVDACGTYTWDEVVTPTGTYPGNGHTYSYLTPAERQSHGMALFYDETANGYVYTYPSDTTFENGVMVSVRVLNLNLMQATYSTETVTVPLSWGSYVINDIDGNPVQTVDFSDRIATHNTTPIVVENVPVGAVAYCDDYRTFTINLIDNYTADAAAYACADDLTYTWNNANFTAPVVLTIGEPGHTYNFVHVENEGTENEWVYTIVVNQRAVNSTTQTVSNACDSYTWTAGDGQTYTTGGTYPYNYTDDNGCAATKTLVLTVLASTHDVFVAENCDSYSWTNNGNTHNYTASGVYWNNYNNAAGCASADTLYLTINTNSNTGYTAAACNSYDWDRDGQTYTTSGDKLYAYTATNGCPSVDTLHLTINLPSDQTYTVDNACNSYVWDRDGQTYTTSGTYTYDYTDANGCASTDQLVLTVNTSTYTAETTTQCDSYEWTRSDNTTATFTESNTYVYDYTNAAGCPSADTLYLTINVNTTGVDETVTACDEYTWAVNNRTYYASGNYSARTTDNNGCATNNTLTLTINNSSVRSDSVMYISEGSYVYTNQANEQIFYGPGSYQLMELYTNAENCPDTMYIALNVGNSTLEVENVIQCNNYTWRDGKTYYYMTAAERAAHNSALYYYLDGTDTTYVYYNPTWTVEQENDYNIVYMLALTLTQSWNGTDEITLPISTHIVNYAPYTTPSNETAYMFTHDFSALDAVDFQNVDSTYEIHFSAIQHCDSIVMLTVHLVNNYEEVVADHGDICVTQTSYTWRGHTISTVTTDYDNAHTYYIYDDINSDNIVEYITVTQHPFAYATERRTACDEYTWNGTTYTESTSNATAYFAAGTVFNAGTDEEYTLVCDSTVTLMLTINHNTNTTYDVESCETYTWAATNGGNGETYTESTTDTYEYVAANGCPSVNTLNLTVYYNTNTEYTVDECDSYTWTAENGGNGNTYTVSGDYDYDYLTAEGNCPSTNTLHLTIRNNSNMVYNEVACDSYVWTNGGDGETYTVSGTYTYDYTAENGCPSTNTLNLTVNENSSFTTTVTVCDSYTWHGTTYTTSTTETYDFADANGCASIETLELTVNYSTNEEPVTVVACNEYTWMHLDGSSAYYTASSPATAPYVYNYTNDAGCPATETLILTIGNGRAYGTQTVVNCGPYTWEINGETIDTFTESIETSATVVNPATGCDSTVFLTLTINPLNITEVAICDNSSYEWEVNGEVYTVAGTYDETLYDADQNCVSNERLILTVGETKLVNLTDQVCLGNGYEAYGFVIDASELMVGENVFGNVVPAYGTGCDSTTMLTLTVGDIIENAVAATACDSYVWTAGDGVDYTMSQSGVYNSTAYPNAAGCTTIDVLTLTINVNAGTEYTETVCDGYMWNGTQYTESGDYTYDYTDGNGCASTDVLHLTVNSSVVLTDEEVVCDSYVWTAGNGEEYTATGVYTYNYTTTDGCNGTRYLVLTVNNSNQSTETVEACDSYTWNSEVFYADTVVSRVFSNVAGCDSIATLDLKVKYNTNGEFTATACDSYIWNNEVLTASGDYTHSYIANNGCPSVDVLHLTVNYNSNQGYEATACEGYDWNNVRYVQSGTYYNLYTNDAGCASVDTLRLTVNNPVYVTLTETACESYTWTVGTGLTYTESTTAVSTLGTAVNGCDSIGTLQLIVNHGTHNVQTATACNSYNWNGANYITTGDYVYAYTNNAGCASADTLHLTINMPTYQTVTATACDEYIWNGTTYTTPGVYNYTTTGANGCDSVTTLVLSLSGTIYTTETAMACDNYTWHGTTYTTSGNYTYNTTDQNGCAQVTTLILTVNHSATSVDAITACESYTWRDGVTYTQNVSGTNAPTVTFMTAGGCDSVISLNLTLLHGTHNAQTVTACNSYSWNNNTYTASGNYIHNYTNNDGCASVDTLHLTINGDVYVTETVVACESYVWHGTVYTESNNTATYTKPGTGTICDTITTLNLTINYGTHNVQSATACNSYQWNGTTYTTTGNYTFSYTNNLGCASVDTLHLTINGATNTTETVTACESYTWHGVTYTMSTNEATYTTIDQNGCANIVTLNLTINNGTYNAESVTACDSYTWHGQEYTSSSINVYQYQNSVGCSSVDTLYLTVNHSNSSIDTLAACDSYEWNGTVYTTSAVLTANGTNVNGCDSVATIVLTINATTYGDDVQVACDEFTWINGEVYTDDANGVEFTMTNVNGCDSIVSLYLTINRHSESYDTMTVALADMPVTYHGEVLTTGGDYRIVVGQNYEGCDSVVFLHLTVTTGGQDGIDDVNVLDELTLWPNPTRGQVTLSAETVLKVEVLDLVGRKVATFENTNTFDLSKLGEGVYTLRITLPEGTAVRKVVKK